MTKLIFTALHNIFSFEHITYDTIITRCDEVLDSHACMHIWMCKYYSVHTWGGGEGMETGRPSWRHDHSLHFIANSNTISRTATFMYVCTVYIYIYKALVEGLSLAHLFLRPPLPEVAAQPGLPRQPLALHAVLFIHTQIGNMHRLRGPFCEHPLDRKEVVIRLI